MYGMCGQTHGQTQGGRVTEPHPCGSLDYFCGTFLPGFLWRITLICLVHSPYLVYLGSSRVCARIS